MITHWIKAKDGKEYPIRNTNGIIMQLAISEGVHSNQIQRWLSDFASWPLGRVYKYYWLMFRYGAKVEDIPFQMDEEDFVFWIGEDDTIMPQVHKVISATNPDAEKKSNQTRVGKK
jgi:hypothetical protein